MHSLAAILPLETLPSWPQVTDPTVLEMLVLTIFIPFGIAAVVAALVLGPGWSAKGE
ncbi:hypothetical protein [Propionicimonas sp.]|uniref:hypothetical protein n=1 Tax=Propionicimonas sp. TaxID=1955623 RepID=UPI0039E436B0